MVEKDYYTTILYHLRETRLSFSFPENLCFFAFLGISFNWECADFPVINVQTSKALKPGYMDGSEGHSVHKWL